MITVRLRKNSARKRWHGFGALLATIAIALQCFLIQTHVDFAPFDSAPAHADAVLSPTHGAGPVEGGKGSLPCIICQDLALTGAFLNAASPAIVLVEYSLSFAAPLKTARTLFTFPAHSWQSRAPPSFL